MKRLILFGFVFSCLVYTTGYGFLFFNNYEKNSTQENIQKLQDEQVNCPTDPWVNYNLGVALYKNRQYDSAKSCFERVGKNTQDPLLTKMGIFNLANSFYSNTLEILPPDWEQQKDLDDKILDHALNEVSQAIAHYKTIINNDKKDIRAVKNNDKAEALRKKLEKKKKQQKQDKQDKKDKKDKQDKNDNKQNDTSKQDKQQDQQDKQDKKDNQQKSSQKDKQDQDKQDTRDKQQPQKQEQGQAQAIKALLDQLQCDESGSQKKIIAHNIKGDKGGDNAQQKPW